MRLLNKFVILMVIILLISVVHPLTGAAQVVDPGCDPLDPACPIDGGLSFLIAAGIGIGAKKAYNKSKRKASAL